MLNQTFPGKPSINLKTTPKLHCHFGINMNICGLSVSMLLVGLNFPINIFYSFFNFTEGFNQIFFFGQLTDNQVFEYCHVGILDAFPGHFRRLKNDC